MPDVFSKQKRSEVMSKIRGINTAPEIIVRKYLFSKGLRYRLHEKNLPGKPDIVLKKHNVAIMVHGCFWHGHSNCKYFRLPKNNSDFWRQKIHGNIKKDAKYKRKLLSSGWRVITVWECQLKPYIREKTLDSLYLKIIQ